jgi:hypothetical protein
VDRVISCETLSPGAGLSKVDRRARERAFDPEMSCDA